MSAAMHNVTAVPRKDTGKSAVRRLRSAGQVPAIAYGKDLAATTLSVAPKDVLAVLKLPEGVEVRLPPEQTLVAVVAPEKEKAEDVAPTGAVPGAVAAAAAGAAGAAAPGAAGAAPGAAGAAPGAAGAAAPAKDAGKDAKKK